jgi:glycosyltransferase involved in cell wall biosynthesis
VLHYRVAIYNHLSKFLRKNGIDLFVLAESVQEENPYQIEFNIIHSKLGTYKIVSILRRKRPDAIILFVNLKNLYLFPVLFFAKFMGVKLIYWGHGKDLQYPNAKIKNLLYQLQFYLVDRILLYSETLTGSINKTNRYKINIANNTLATNRKYFSEEQLQTTRDKYCIAEKVLIICVGRIKKYKRIQDLIDAFKNIQNPDIGLLLVGPDDEGLIGSLEDRRIHYLNAVYGDELGKLLSIASIYCMPGALGLSIVDAFQYGLPIVTENVHHGPEIMYLNNGVNGFIVPVGDIDALSEKLKLLSNDAKLRESMSEQAIKEINVKGSIELMCEGFLDAITACCEYNNSG